MRTAAFLDRDGVINRSKIVEGVPKPPSTVEEVEILEGVLEAIRILEVYNFVPVVVTNQPDVARGLIPKARVEQINAHVGGLTGIKHFYTCFHDNFDSCECRKPAPGLLIRAAIDLNLDISNSFMVGDRWRDISAGQAVGCKTFFIDHSYPEKSPKLPYTTVSSLLEATQIMTGDHHGAH